MKTIDTLHPDIMVPDEPYLYKGKIAVFTLGSGSFVRLHNTEQDYKEYSGSLSSLLSYFKLHPEYDGVVDDSDGGKLYQKYLDLSEKTLMVPYFTFYGYDKVNYSDSTSQPISTTL